MRGHFEGGPGGAQPAVLAQIAERLPGMTRKRQRLAQIVLDSPELIAFGSAREVAAKIGIDAATIVRFAQSLGYNGFGPFKGAIRRAYLQSVGRQAPRDAPYARGDGVTEAIRALHRQNIERAYGGLRSADLEAIADRMIVARRIFIAGEGSAVVAATLLQRLLRHVGLEGRILNSSGVDRVIGMYGCGPGDVVVDVSLWLTYRGAIDVLAQARQTGATTVAITGRATNAVTNVADYVVVAPAQGVPLSFSIVATVAIIEALASHIATKRIDESARIEHDLQRAYVRNGLIAPEDLG